MHLALNKLQRLICNKTRTTNQTKRKSYISFGLRLNYLPLFSVYTKRSWESGMLLLTVMACFIWPVFLRVVRVFFATPSKCLTTSATISVMALLLTSKAPQRCGDILFHSLKAISNFDFFGYFTYISQIRMLVFV